MNGAALGGLHCGIMEGRLVYINQALPTTSECTDPTATYSGAIEAFQPDWIVWSVGANEIFDHAVGSQIFRAGTGTFDFVLRRRLDELTRLAENANAKVAVMTPACIDKNAPKVQKPVAHLRQTLIAYARSRSRRVRLIDWYGELCGPGQDVPARWWTAGGLTEAGARHTWQWIERELVHN